MVVRDPRDAPPDDEPIVFWMCISLLVALAALGCGIAAMFLPVHKDQIREAQGGSGGNIVITNGASSITIESTDTNQLTFGTGRADSVFECRPDEGFVCETVDHVGRCLISSCVTVSGHPSFP